MFVFLILSLFQYSSSHLLVMVRVGGQIIDFFNFYFCCPFLIKIQFLFPINTFFISMFNIKFTNENTNITLDPERAIFSFALINMIVTMGIMDMWKKRMQESTFFVIHRGIYVIIHGADKELNWLEDTITFKIM